MSWWDWVLGSHLIATVGMAGLIWFVQVVHYPLMARVGDAQFVAYAAAHVRRTTTVVAPLMLTELATSLVIWVKLRAGSGPTWHADLGVALLCVVWLSTALLQVPCHRVLERGMDLGAVRRLVSTNWIRTSAWTARVAVALVLWSQRPTPVA